MPEAPRPPCAACVLKHLGQACVLFQESLQGYPVHRWIAMAHLAEAEAESQGISSQFARMLRNERKAAEDNVDYVPDCVSLMDDLAARSDDVAEAVRTGSCSTCDKIKSNTERDSLDGLADEIERIAGG